MASSASDSREIFKGQAGVAHASAGSVAKYAQYIRVTMRKTR